MISYRVSRGGFVSFVLRPCVQVQEQVRSCREDKDSSPSGSTATTTANNPKSKLGRLNTLSSKTGMTINLQLKINGARCFGFLSLFHNVRSLCGPGSGRACVLNHFSPCSRCSRCSVYLTARPRPRLRNPNIQAPE